MLRFFNATCIAPRDFLSFNQSSFKFGPNYVDLCLFYNCISSFPDEYRQHPRSCASNALYQSYAVMDNGKNEINSTAMPCQSFDAAPVDLGRGKNSPSTENLDDSKLLINGFTLTWIGNSCEQCERIGVIVGLKEMKWFISAPINPTRRIAVMVDSLIYLNHAFFTLASQFSAVLSLLSLLGAHIDEIHANAGKLHV